jgi:hypothetical protein
VYVTAGGARFHVPDEATLRSVYCPSYPSGICWNNIWHGAILTLPDVPRDGSLVRDVANGAIHVIFGGARFQVPNTAVLQQLYCPAYPATTCAQALWPAAVSATTTTPADNTLLRESDHPATYAVCQGARWHIPNPEVFVALQYDWSRIGVLWPDGLTLPETPNTDTVVLPPGDRACDGADGDDDNDAAADATETAEIASNPLDPDTDDDAGLDGLDNCPLWANSGGALPSWPVAAADHDCDGFSRDAEIFNGTSPAGHCAATVAPNDEPADAWPADMDDDGAANLRDLLAMGPSFNSQSGGPGYNPRFDLTRDGQVSISDVIVFGPFYNKSCS